MSEGVSVMSIAFVVGHKSYCNCPVCTVKSFMRDNIGSLEGQGLPGYRTDDSGRELAEACVNREQCGSAACLNCDLFAVEKEG